MLEAFPSVSIPIETLMEIGSRLAVRYYTISSSNTVFPDKVHMTVSTVNQSKTEGRVHVGICSRNIAEANSKYLHDMP